MDTKEIWRDAPDPFYADRYRVSSHGRVLSVFTNQLLNPIPHHRGGYHVVLVKEGKRRSVALHRLVAAAFKGPLRKWYEVKHLDGDRGNNHVENLLVIPRRTWERTTGAANPKAKLNDSKVRAIKRLLHSQKPVADIATEFGVSPSTIYRIWSGWTWTHVL